MSSSQSVITVVNRLSVGPLSHVRVGGVLDETFDVATLSGEMIGHVLLDLGRIERISSFGVRKWIEFVSRTFPEMMSLSLIHLPPLFVDQLNMVEGFAGQAAVLSILAPYTCPQCGEDRVRLVDLLTEGSRVRSRNAPAHQCPVCSSPLDFADRPEEYFDFVSHHLPGQIDERVRRYLASLRPPIAGSVDGGGQIKLVADDLTYFRMGNHLGPDLNVRRIGAGLEGRVVYDFASVSTVEAGAGAKLLRAFETASANATLILWRVPPVVLTELAALNKPLPAGLATLYLPCDCRQCGTKDVQRVSATEYLAQLSGGQFDDVPCSICTGKSRMPALVELRDFLENANRVTVDAEEIDALEPRALSRYLAGAPELTGHFERPQPVANHTTERPARVELLRQLGRGGMAEVFLAKQVGMRGFEKYIVVKRVLESHAQQPALVDMLFAEARANARLSHPNIVQTYDVGLIRGVPFIAMEYVRGPDARRATTMLASVGLRWPARLALRIVVNVARALHYAHNYVDPTGVAHPIVHRDVSPHNVLLSLDGVVKLSDFGIAKALQESERSNSGALKGKVSYLPPEAIRGEQVDARADVFSLGVTAFELLTGQNPYRRDNHAATMQAIISHRVKHPSVLDPSLPSEIGDWIVRMQEKDPAQRPSSAEEVADGIERLMTRHRLLARANEVAAFLLEHVDASLTDFAPDGSGAPSTMPVGSASRAPLKNQTETVTPRTSTAGTEREDSIIELGDADVVLEDGEDLTDPTGSGWPKSD